MTERVFADTNVWVYLFDSDEPVKQGRAREVLAPRSGVRHVTSAQVMSEFYVNATRKLARPVAPDRAAQIVERMGRLDVVAIDVGRVRAAIDGARSWGISYWDALIVVAAQAGGCTRLLTEDLADGATYGTVRVENPFRVGHRASEVPASYEPGLRTWSDDELLVALADYEEACRQAGMRPNAIHSYWDYARRFLAWRTGEYRPRGATGQGRPVPTDRVMAAELAGQARAYAEVIQGAGRELPTVETYYRHAMFFVRWLTGDFQPGGRLQHSSLKSRAAPHGRSADARSFKPLVASMPDVGRDEDFDIERVDSTELPPLPEDPIGGAERIEL
jgi:predicted nucleic acid-binding protein